jgi:hypothetical protein
MEKKKMDESFKKKDTETVCMMTGFVRLQVKAFSFGKAPFHSYI